MSSFASSGFSRLQAALIFFTSIRRTQDESPQCPCAPHSTQGPGRTTPPSPGHTAWWPGPGSGLTRLLVALGLGEVIVVFLVNSLAPAQHSSASSTVHCSVKLLGCSHSLHAAVLTTSSLCSIDRNVLHGPMSHLLRSTFGCGTFTSLFTWNYYYG